MLRTVAHEIIQEIILNNTQKTRYIGATSPDLSSVWLYEFGCCAGDHSVAAFELPKFADLPRARIRQIFGVRTLEFFAMRA